MNVPEKPDMRAEFARVEHLMRIGKSIFVFGSNLAGFHGGGAAHDAYEKYSAQWTVGEGPTGGSYAIPTKDIHIRTLPLVAVAESVARFISYARRHPELIFVVTRVGCGLAGFTDEQIAPLFATAPKNCRLPHNWEVVRDPDI